MVESTSPARRIGRSRIFDAFFGVNCTHFFGPEGLFVENRHASFKQALKDRNFLSVALSRTF